MNRVDGKAALVSGAARGIGAATARLLAEAGARVAITDMRTELGEATAREIEAAGGEALFLQHDVTCEAGWAEVVDTVEARFGALNVLVNNAGIFQQKSIEETTLEDWRRMTAVNLDGVFLGTRAALPLMRRTAEESGLAGSIINLSSIAGIVGGPFSAAYHMSKGGVRLFTKATAIEFAVLGYNIRANSVHPGVIESDMTQQVFEGFADRRGGDVEAARQRIARQSPLRRNGEPADIARAVLFLASEDSAFMTGTEVIVDGGLTAR